MRISLTTAMAVGLCAAAAGPARPQAVPRTSTDHGTVAGTVQLGAAEKAAPAMLSPYARRRYTPPAAAASRAGSAEDVVVYVLVDEAASVAAPREVSIVQRNRMISPHVTAVPVGTRVHFPNEDNVFHNLFSLSSAQPFNLGRYPRGQSREQTFGRAGVVRLFCDIHSDMTAVILVLNTPYFTRADENGRFRITGVPEGRHRVVAWHESAGADTVEVMLSANATATVDLRLQR